MNGEHRRSGVAVLVAIALIWVALVVGFVVAVGVPQRCTRAEFAAHVCR